MNLLISRFETYLLDEEHVELEVKLEKVEVEGFEQREYPEGFFSSL